MPYASAGPASRMPNPRDYPDPIGYAVASADWWRAQVHDVNTARTDFSAASRRHPARRTTTPHA